MPAVGDFLVLGERVHDQREHALIGAERRGERMGGGFPLLRVGVLQFGEQRFERQLFAFEREAQRGDRVVEQSIPGGDPGDRLFQEQLLDVVGELVRTLLADVLQPGAIMGERGAARRRVESRVVEAIEFEFEEQQFSGERGDLFLRVAIEFAPRDVAGVARVEQRRVGHDPAHQILQRFVSAHRRAQTLARVRGLGEFRELALIGRRKSPGVRGGAPQIGGEARRVHAFIEVVEPPLRQDAQVLSALLSPAAARGDGLENARFENAPAVNHSIGPCYGKDSICPMPARLQCAYLRPARQNGTALTRHLP
jgi:hypothetical protein